MVLLISSCTQFLTLKVAVILTLTVTLITEIGAVPRGACCTFRLSKHYRYVSIFSLMPSDTHSQA